MSLIDKFRRMGATITDGPVGPDFTQGWSHVISFKSRAMTAHYFTVKRPSTPEDEIVAESGEAARGLRFLTSACGLQRFATNRVPLLTAGNLPYCARCEAKLMERMKT